MRMLIGILSLWLCIPCIGYARGTYTSITAGAFYNMVLKFDNTIWGWGYNNFGAIGDGTYADVAIPKQISSGSDWASIVGKNDHTMGIKTSGQLWAWGVNAYGQLGDGNAPTGTTLPHQISSDTTWYKIGKGNYHSLALKNDHTLWAWGRNDYGQLGDGTTDQKNSPFQIGLDTDWSEVSGGLYFTLALKSNGTLWAWGDNTYGKLGLGDTRDTAIRKIPTQVGVDTHWSKINAGNNHSLAIKDDGTLWVWGWNEWGQLGDGTNINRYAPVQIGSDTHWKEISVGRYFNLAIKTDGTLWAWGVNSSGQLGDGTTTGRTTPVQIGVDTAWVEVAAGATHSIARKSDGTIWLWGNNTNHQLGDNTTTNKLTPEMLFTIYYVSPMGDVNGDNQITLADAISALQAITRIPLQVTIYADADVNGDGRIGLQEVIYIMQKIAGLR